jgi:hypothetical protein
MNTDDSGSASGIGGDWGVAGAFDVMELPISRLVATAASVGIGVNRWLNLSAELD